jgi:tetratricopeptide (TPR) repeat protein
MCRVLEKRPGDAIAEFREVLAVEPDNLDALIQLGMVLHDQGEHAGAVEALARFHAIRPGDADSAYYLAASLGRLGRIAESETILRRSLESSPGSSRLLMELTRTLMLTGRRCRALSYVQRLEAMDLDASSRSLVARTLATLEDECVGGG